MAVENELVIFKGDQEREPVTMTLNGPIRAVAVSPCKKYIVAAVKTHINIYEIRKASNLVLFKNFSDLKIATVALLSCYEGNGPRVCFVD
jgi:hypothetical protein